MRLMRSAKLVDAARIDQAGNAAEQIGAAAGSVIFSAAAGGGASGPESRRHRQR